MIHGIPLNLATPEDVLIAKLEWAKLSESERQLEDAAGIIDTQRESLDREYIERWVAELGVERQWQEALKRAG